MDVFSIFLFIYCLISPLFLVGACWLAYALLMEKKRARTKEKELIEKIEIISQSALIATREIWLDNILSQDFNSELEVEAKFIYPMMNYLGYSMQSLKMRLPIIVKVGRQDVQGYADWVAYKDNKPYIIVEAKEKNQQLNDAVKQQARSYCFALNAPLYLITNGKEILVYRRGVESDQLICHSSTADLKLKWSHLFDLIGVAS